MNIGADVELMFELLCYFDLYSPIDWIMDIKMILVARNGITEELGEKALFSEIPNTRNTRRF